MIILCAICNFKWFESIQNCILNVKIKVTNGAGLVRLDGAQGHLLLFALHCFDVIDLFHGVVVNLFGL